MIRKTKERPISTGTRSSHQKLLDEDLNLVCQLIKILTARPMEFASALVLSLAVANAPRVRPPLGNTHRWKSGFLMLLLLFFRGLL